MSSPYPRRCPRCGITLASDQAVHLSCVRARAWQVAWRMAVVIAILLGIVALVFVL